MLILKKLPQGSIYPQITQAPITNYPDFLNFFRGGHTIDDNLGARNIQDTVQYTMFNTAIASGHLTKLKNMAIPDEFLADIFLTESGSELGQTVFDRKFCEIAVAEARKSMAMFRQRDTEAKREMEGTLNSVLLRKSTMMWITSI